MYVPALAVTTETDSYRLSPWPWPLTRRVQSAMATRTHVRTGTSCDHSDRLKPSQWLIKSKKSSVGSDRAKVHTGTDHRDRLTIPVTLTKYEKSSIGRDRTDYWPALAVTMHRERNRPSTWLTERRVQSVVQDRLLTSTNYDHPGDSREEFSRQWQLGGETYWPALTVTIPVTREKSSMGSDRTDVQTSTKSSVGSGS